MKKRNLGVLALSSVLAFGAVGLTLTTLAGTKHVNADNSPWWIAAQQLPSNPVYIDLQISWNQIVCDSYQIKGIKGADEFKNDANQKVVPSTNIPEGYQGLDIGPEAILEFTEILKNAKTVMWNGPLGVFEFENFAKGTNAIAKVLSEINAVTVVGGGDSVSAIEKGGFSNKITHVSTGGGASLEFLEGKPLPGIECLDNK